MFLIGTHHVSIRNVSRPYLGSISLQERAFCASGAALGGVCSESSVFRLPRFCFILVAVFGTVNLLFLHRNSIVTLRHSSQWYNVKCGIQFKGEKAVLNLGRNAA